ncbi:hypothetical protein AW079_04940, partial [Escherichia coli]
MTEYTKRICHNSYNLISLSAYRGNHEQMMIDGLSERGNVNHWLLNGGGWFFNLDYDKEILAKA